MNALVCVLEFLWLPYRTLVCKVAANDDAAFQEYYTQILEGRLARRMVVLSLLRGEMKKEEFIKKDETSL